eukprot:SAG31_NODE_924_length_10963_cov_4.339286_1_plen_253_part_00
MQLSRSKQSARGGQYITGTSTGRSDDSRSPSDSDRTRRRPAAGYCSWRYGVCPSGTYRTTHARTHARVMIVRVVDDGAGGAQPSASSMQGVLHQQPRSRETYGFTIGKHTTTSSAAFSHSNWARSAARTAAAGTVVQGGAVEALQRTAEAAVRAAAGGFPLSPHCRLSRAALASAGIDGASAALDAAETELQAAASAAAADHGNLSAVFDMSIAVARAAKSNWPEHPNVETTSLHHLTRDLAKLTRWRVKRR